MHINGTSFAMSLWDLPFLHPQASSLQDLSAAGSLKMHCSLECAHMAKRLGTMDGFLSVPVPVISINVIHYAVIARSPAHVKH